MGVEGVQEVRRRYFDLIIHFCRSTPVCWGGRKTGERGNIGGKITNILRTSMSELKKVKDKKTGIVRVSNIELNSCNHFCYGNAIGVTYSECVVVALVIEHASACAVLSSVACPTVQYFFFYIVS